jgi:cell division protein FtsX
MKRYLRGWTTTSILILVVIVALATAGVTALLVNIVERKTEAKQNFVRLVEVTEDTTDPAEWGINFLRQYDSYLRTPGTASLTAYSSLMRQTMKRSAVPNWSPPARHRPWCR